MWFLTAFESNRSYAAKRLHQFRSEAGMPVMLSAALLFAVLTAWAAQVRLLLPFTPVPFTGQVLVVLLGGFVLGRYGAVSMGIYLGLGAAFGWFSGMIGPSALTGATAGYLFGFVAAAMLIGELAHRREEWSFAQILLVMSLGALIIYALGAFWLGLYLRIDMATAVLIGVIPFIIVDALKVASASAAAFVLTTRRA